MNGLLPLERPTYFRDKVLVSDAASTPFSYRLTPLPIDVVQQIEQVLGVAVAVPRVLLLMNSDDPSNAFQQPSFVVGYTVGADRGHETFPLEIAQGRFVTSTRSSPRLAQQVGVCIQLPFRSPKY